MNSARTALVLSVLCLALLLLFVAYPTASVLLCSFRSGMGWSLGNYIALTDTHGFSRLILQSMAVSAASATMATLLGSGIAVLAVKTTAPLRRLFAFAAILPIILPGFITAIAYIFLFGRNGLITYKVLGLSWNVYSWKSVFILQTLDQTSTAFLMVAAVLATMGNSLEEAAQTFGASQWHILRTIILRQAAPMMLAAFLLNFMRAMGDFATPLIVGGPFDTLASASYSQLIGRYNLSMAATYNVVLLLISMATYTCYTMVERRSAAGRETSWRTGNTEGVKKLHLQGFSGLGLWCMGLLFTTLVAMLVVAVFLAAFTRHIGYDYSLTIEYFHAILDRGLSGTFNTIVFAFAVGLSTSIGGQLLAYLIQRLKVPGHAFIDSLATIPFALPGTFIGVGYAIAFNSPPLLLSGSWLIIAANLIVRKLPLGLRTGTTLLARLDRSLDEASTLLGSSRLKSFFKIILPHLRPAMLVCGLYSFITTIQALGSIIFIITPGTKLLSVEVFEAVIRGDLGIAAAYSMLMLVIGAAVGALLIAISWQRQGATMHSIFK